MQVLESVRLLRKVAERRIEEILAEIWGEDSTTKLITKEGETEVLKEMKDAGTVFTTTEDIITQ